MRLNRYLAAAGHGSRRACEDLIREGRVTINGKLILNLATEVREGDAVVVNGKLAHVAEKLVLMLHKPMNVICSTVDLEGRKTVFDFIPKKFPRLFYVGRLDADSEGLLIMTNDGDLSQRLTHPAYKLPKTYHVWLDRDFDAVEHASRLLKGFPIPTGMGRFESVYKVSPREIKVVLTQGLKRQIRLMLHRLGYRVKRLVRTQIGTLTLEDVKPGEWRMLGKNDLAKLSPAPRKSRPATKDKPTVAPGLPSDKTET